MYLISNRVNLANKHGKITSSKFSVKSFLATYLSDHLSDLTTNFVTHVWPTQGENKQLWVKITSSDGSLRHAAFEEVLEKYPEMKTDFGSKTP